MPAFTKCYFHAVWAVKHRNPILIPPVEQVVLAAIVRKAESMRCHLYAANGALDHVHVAIEIPPTHAPSQIIGALKGITSHVINGMSMMDDRFEWQSGYGLITFGPRALEDVVEYIENQKQRHKLGQISPGLERTE